MTAVLWAWLALMCVIYRVPFEQAVAVAHIESRNKHHAFRVGPMGRSHYGGPFGVKDCFEGWDDPYDNIRLGVKALARLTRKHGSFWKALHFYNTEWTQAYENEIKKAIRRVRDEARSVQQDDFCSLSEVGRGLE